MKGLKRLCVLLALVMCIGASPAYAEKFVIGFQPYDTISYQVIVNAEMGMWKKYVPAGTEFEFMPALQGTVVANNMLAGKAVVGHMSVMPATILSSKHEQAEIKMVATSGMSEGTRCSVVLVRKDAPEFKSNEELAAWLNGKVIAAPKAAPLTSTCAVSLKPTRSSPVNTSTSPLKLSPPTSASANLTPLPPGNPLFHVLPMMWAKVLCASLPMAAPVTTPTWASLSCGLIS